MKWSILDLSHTGPTMTIRLRLPKSSTAMPKRLSWNKHSTLIAKIVSNEKRAYWQIYVLKSMLLLIAC